MGVKTSGPNSKMYFRLFCLFIVIFSITFDPCEARRLESSEARWDSTRCFRRCRSCSHKAQAFFTKASQGKNVRKDTVKRKIMDAANAKLKECVRMYPKIIGGCPCSVNYKY